MNEGLTPKQIRRAAEMWASGLSYGKIAKELKTTANAIAGYANRNRDMFPKKGNATGKHLASATVKPERKVKLKPKPAPVVKAPEPPPVRADAVRFADIGSYRCKWVMQGEPGPDMLCCNQPTVSMTAPIASSYCAEHLKRMYYPSTRRVA